MADSSQAKVQVAVRIRPLLEKFGEAYSVKSAKKAAEDNICMTHPIDDSPNSGKQYVYAYNYVFDEDDSQSDIYEAIKDLVDSTLDGHNATIFTYGQTGSGKTHTVLGNVGEVEGKVVIGEQTGLYMRVLDDLLRYKAANTARTHVVLTLSILEIHLEVIKDLLNGCKVLELQRNRFGDDGVSGLKLTEVDSLQQCFEVFKIGNSHRSVASTNMNDVSSRSHAVFMIDILQQEKTADTPDPPNANDVYATDFAKEETAPPKVPIRRSRLCLVDLAGSERLKKSGAEGQTLKETQAINASLSCLGNVVNALYEGKQFVGYRDSKLTMLLKSSFERANAKVMLITNISPIQASFQESMGSLRFADRIMGLRAKQVFMIDADSEQDYLESLRTHAELCADLRIAIATHDLKLHGSRRLQQLKSKDGKFSQDTVKQLAEEHKQQVEAQNQKKLNQLITKLITQRSMVDEREARITDDLGWQLKVDEQDLVRQAADNEEKILAEDLELKKEEYKAMKKLQKSCEKTRDDIQKAVVVLREELAVAHSQFAKLLSTVMAEEEAFGNRGELPEDMRKPEPPPPPPQPAAAAEETGSRTPPPNHKAASSSSSVAKRAVSGGEITSDVSSMENSRSTSPSILTPPLSKKSPVTTSSGTATTSSRTSKPSIEQLERASSATSELRKNREQSIRKFEEESAHARQLALQATKIGAKKKKKPKNEDDEDGEGGEDGEEEEEDDDEEVSAAEMDRRRMKELLKASGLKKAEIAKILERMNVS